MNYKRILVILTVSSVLLFLCFLGFGGKEEESAEKEKEIPSFYENVLATPYIPSLLKFAGEQVPLDIHWVQENLEKEIIVIAYQHSKTLHTLKRIPRFFPVIEKILKEEGVPEDFKYLCVAESNLENLVSPAKAAGYWQFLESTAKSYGLTVNEEVDERYDLEKSTRAACKYLKGCKERLGSWTLAAAAYNMGENGLYRNIEKQQNSQYWELYLNRETSRYVYRIIAYKLIFEQPLKYGVKMTRGELYYPVPYREYKVTESIPDLYEFARSQNATYLELKQMNPWLRNSKLTLRPERYTIRIPKKSKTTYHDLLQHVEQPQRILGDSMFHVEKEN